MKVYFVTSEAVPFVSTGGLGDVSGSLPKALAERAVDVTVVMPMYRSFKDRVFARTRIEYEGTVALGWRRQYLGVRSLEEGGVRFFFIDNDYYFGREMVYGNYDDGERFAFFGRAVCETARVLPPAPDVIHSNDWQSAAAVVYLKRQFPSLSRVKAVFTVHNAEYQGKFDPYIAGDVFGIDDGDVPLLTHRGDLNLMKGAVVLADRVTTVSPRYARELTTEYFGCGLDPVFAAKGVSGILNGIDTALYDPSADPSIPARYSPADLSGKAADRAALCGRFGISDAADRPVVGIVSRLVAHKGVDLLVRVADEIVGEGTARLCVLGTGDEVYERFFRGLAERHPGDVGAIVAYDRDLARLVYAGADAFLMPSRSEPCGISQMIASRYGTPPIVRETGGLSDTVEPYDEYADTGTGFSFRNYNAHEMKRTVAYAASVWRDAERWGGIVRRGMAADRSWARSADGYVGLYRELTEG